MAEVRHKSFTSKQNFEADLGIAEGLNRHTLREIKKTNIPVFTFNENNQTGNSFGEKLENAFSALFDEGFNYVIAVGNDTPSLKAKHILQARDLLEAKNSEIILGPATDGGAWLMGFAKSAFHTGDFSQLAWNSDQLLHSIFKEYKSTYQIYLLDYFSDLDNETDIRRFLSVSNYTGALANFYRFVVSLLTKKIFFYSSPQIAVNEDGIHFNFSLRAPPLFI